MDTIAYPTSACGHREEGHKCIRSFHVRCAIKRGLITDYETMLEHQYDESFARPVALCAKHTLEKRFLDVAT